MNITTYALFKQLFDNTLIVDMQGNEIQDHTLIEVEILEDGILASELILQ